MKTQQHRHETKLNAWQRIASAEAWQSVLNELPQPHVLQSWAWGDFKSRWGWQAERYAFVDDEQKTRAALQMLRRHIGPVCAIYVPKGPVAIDLASYDLALAWVERQARSRLAVWAKADGDPCFDLPSLRRRLHARGWFFAPQQVQFRNTLFTHVRRADTPLTDEALISAMKQKWRYNVRLAERRGVTIRLATEQDYSLLYDMYVETGKRDGFIIREAAYYADAWRTMGGVGLIAQREGTPLAGLILFAYANRVWYFYGMSRTEGREHMATYALQWAALRWARDHGYEIYDWWGAPNQLDENDAMWGVYRFKEGFGADFVEGIGAWDFAPNKIIYKFAQRFKA